MRAQHRPHHQHFASQRWIGRQTLALVPGGYCLITVTLLFELREPVGQHQRVLYPPPTDSAWDKPRTWGKLHTLRKSAKEGDYLCNHKALAKGFRWARSYGFFTPTANG